MLMFLLAWLLLTLLSGVGLLAFLAFDEWQVRGRQPEARRQNRAEQTARAA
jgi:hypothetical protein